MNRLFILLVLTVTVAGRAAEYQVAPFEAIVTIPVGHACMGGGIAGSDNDRKRSAPQIGDKGAQLTTAAVQGQVHTAAVPRQSSSSQSTFAS